MKYLIALLALVTFGGTGAAPLQLQATDSEGDSVTWTYTGLPSGFTATPEGYIDDAGADTPGDYTVSAIPFDGTDNGPAIVFAWEVTQAPPPTECADGIDNDGDGEIDLADPGCPDESGDNEASADPNTPPVGVNPGPQSTVIPYSAPDPDPDPVPTAGIHDSEWSLPGDEIDGADIRVEAVTPYGFWVSYRLDADRSPTRPHYRLNGSRVRYSGIKMGSDAGFGGNAGAWIGPFYWYDLEPETTYTISFEQPGGNSTEELTVTTRPAPAAPGQDFACSPATLGLTPDADWVSAVRAEASSGWNPATLQGGYRAYPKALLAAFTGNAQDIANAQSILEFAIAPRANNDEDASGSQHRWEGAYAAWAASCLYRQGYITESKLIEVANAYVGDLENIVVSMTNGGVNGNRTGFDDSDKLISNDRIGIIAGSMYTLLPAGSLRDRLQAVYDFHTRRFHAVRLAMLRINTRFGVGSGWPNDGTEYGVGTIKYFLEVLWWMQNDRPAEVAQYVPWLVNAAYQQAHQRAPGGGTRFSWGDHIPPIGDEPQSDTRSLLGYLIATHGGPTNVTEHLASITGNSYEAWNALPVAAGPGRMETTFIARGGDATAVFSRTGWGATDNALMVKFGGRGVHHNHPDSGDIGYIVGSSVRLRETPNYGYPNTTANHNVPTPLAGNYIAGAGFELTSLTLPFDLLLTEDDGLYAITVTRRVQWDGSVVTVTDTGAAGANWEGPVGNPSPGVYTIQ